MPTRLVLAWLILAVAVAVRPAHARFDERAFSSDLSRLAAEPSRAIGSDGYQAAVAYVAGEIARLAPAVQLQRHEFTVMMPVTKSASIRLGETTHTIYPFWPAGVRVNATPADGITGELVYCGNATLPEIPAQRVDGNIAVIESSAGSSWSSAVYFGARAVIVLGSDQTTHAQLREFELFIPVNFPRFYVPQGAVADALRKAAGRATIRASVSWEPRTATNLYAFVPASKPIPEGWPANARPPAALMITAGLDSSSLVPDLSPGAGQAVQPAVALGLLREFAAAPLNRPVVFFFSGADSVQMLGQRQMFAALADAPVTWRRELSGVERDIAAVRRDAKRLESLGGDPTRLDITADRELIDRIARLIEVQTTLAQDELFRLRRARPDELSPEMLARRSELERHIIRLNQVRYAFQSHPARLASEEFAGSARGFLKRTEEKLESLAASFETRRAELGRRIELYEWLAGALGREKNPDERDVSQRLIELQLGLDFSDGGVRAGPMFYGMFQRSNSLLNLQDYRDWAARLERDFAREEPSAAWWTQARKAFDFEPLNQVRAPQSYLCAPMAIPTEMAQPWGVPGMTIITLDDLRLRRDTPNDTLERLNIGAILPQVLAAREVIVRAWNDPKFVSRVQPKRQRAALTGQVVSPATGRPVPDLPRDGFLITYYYTQNVSRKIPQLSAPGNFSYTCGVRRTEVIPADDDGRYRIEGLPQLHPFLQFFAPQAYRIAPETGQIVACTDLGKGAGDLKPYADIRQDVPPQRLLVFGCQEFSIVGLYDPRYLQELGEVVPLDARRNAEPQRYNMLLQRQMMAGFLEPGSVAYLAFRYGRVGNRLLLLNMPDPASGAAPRGRTQGDGRGFTVQQLDDLSALALVTANDFWRLDQKRLGEYRKAGVSSTLIDDLHKTAAQQLSRAQAARSADDAVAMVREGNGAWANEARVYDATRALAGDVVRGAIFLLLLLAPFSFCMERLLIGTANVYKQIAYTAAIFAVMTAVLWSFHPAFKISSSPLIIILAFAIILMSCIVIWVIYGKFDAELKRIRSTRGSAQGASFARAGVLMSAVLLGIANMRKRKFRTALTSLTIVLITFAVLCFTSSTVYVGTSSLVTGQSSSHPGIMLRQRGFRPMPADAVQNFAAALGPNVRIVERWWNLSASDPRDLVSIVSPAKGGGSAKSVGAAILGLSPGESRLSRIGEVIGPEKFARLEEGATDVIYLSRMLAEQIGAVEGDTLLVGGIPLRLAGVFASEEFDQKVYMLSGEPLTPLRYTVGMLDASGRRIEDTAAEAMDLDASAAASEAGSAYEHLPSSQIAIVPAAVSRILPNAALRSVAFRLEDEKQVKAVSDELARRFALALFAGFDDGVRMIAASNLSDVAGGAKVAIPLLIGGMIIFNTMMGSIAERKREIHVYTSLGLAPMHVGALFVAEAMTYGLIGTVFGYIIGQSVGTLLSHLGWLGGATLNYSGTSAMLTMGLILLVVLASSLVPARLASKVAAPSIDRSWKVPQPDGDQIRAILPFTINKTAADGVLAYLAEFLNDHREGSIGKFSASEIAPFALNGSRGLDALIWLTPFDLGLRQRMKLEIHPTDSPEIYEVRVTLNRLSGDDASWWRMNRTFLTELRKQFLAWRSLPPETMREYVERSRELAHDAVSV